VIQEALHPTGTGASFPVGKADHSTPTSATVKKTWIYTYSWRRPFRKSATIRTIVTGMDDGCWVGSIVGMISRGIPSTWRKPAPVQLWPEPESRRGRKPKMNILRYGTTALPLSILTLIVYGMTSRKHCQRLCWYNGTLLTPHPRNKTKINNFRLLSNYNGWSSSYGVGHEANNPSP
jgi:hypothetical protein